MLQKLTNHPVHLSAEEGNVTSTTAMIPFCEMGGSMSAMGVKTDQFDVPVCNSFRPRIIMDQLCYTVDPNKYKDRVYFKGELSLTLFIHYNEDRQFKNMDSSEEHAIIIDTIGNIAFVD